MRIGFIGQGYVGKNYADNFESRGYEVERYSLEPEYIANKSKVHDCEVIFIAVPTPTTPSGFDSSALESTLNELPGGRVVVIKSTVLPGTTKKLQEQFPELTILFSPEFLRENTAREDVDNPHSTIIGITVEEDRPKAEEIMKLMPAGGSEFIVDSNEAELFKYIQNISGYANIVLFNIFYDLGTQIGCNWNHLRELMEVDPNIPSYFANPVHKGGRGAGGHCLIKDLAAFNFAYPDYVLFALEQKNLEYLKNSGKDQDLVEAIYG